MGRGARQEQALSFSSPFRGRSSEDSPPHEFGQRRFRYHLDRGNGKIDDNPGPLARVRETAKSLTPVGSGFWQIVQETAMKDKRGRLFWDKEVVASYRADLYSRQYIENLTEEIQDKPLGKSIEEQVQDGERYIRIVDRRPQHTASRPWKGEHKIAEDRPFMEISTAIEKIKPGKEKEAHQKIEKEFKRQQGRELDRRQRELDGLFSQS